MLSEGLIVFAIDNSCWEWRSQLGLRKSYHSFNSNNDIDININNNIDTDRYIDKFIYILSINCLCIFYALHESCFVANKKKYTK